MPEKKKPDSAKITAKKKVTKNKTTKKVTQKTTVKNKATQLNTVSKKKSVTKKVVVPSNEGAKFLCWETWKSLFFEAFLCWKNVVWRYAGVFFLSFGLQLVGVIVFIMLGAVGLVNFKSLENIVANLQVGTFPSLGVVLPIMLLFMVWSLYMVMVILMSKVAFLAVIGNYVKGKKQPVLDLFFKEGVYRALGYLGLGFCVFGYVVWPVFAGVVGATVVSGLITTPENTVFSINLIALLPLCLGLLGAVYFAIRALFVMPLYIHTNQKALAAFAQATSLTKGAWWYTASMWLLFVVLLYAVNSVIGFVSAFDPITLMGTVDSVNSMGLVDLLAFLFSLFIFAPITLAFQYLLMLNVAKNKSVKI